MQIRTDRAPETSGRAMSRRDVLTAATALAGAAAVAGVAGADDPGEHASHQVAGFSGEEHEYFEAVAYKRRADLVAATNACIAKGQACISHCMETFLMDDTTMAECAMAVQEMLAVCNAMAHLAAYDSKNLGPMARACAAVCEECEKQCRVHEEHQEECRACAEGCAALLVELKKV